ncbi:MAG TPA: HAMP domain-containing sensor histidine kinase, partial [Polyangiaceae bacterium]|nr:HAMP domain-containing sensor histidine kinase [Polyangiaceae bacterium]
MHSGLSFRARLALALVATLVALPTPAAPWLGGSPAMASWPPLVVLCGWLACAGVLGRTAGSSGEGVSATRQGWALLVDVAGLTAQLALAGAAQNPFTMLYFVPIALATLLSRGWTWLVAGAAVSGFALLLWRSAGEVGLHAHHGHFFHHVAGMAVALAVAGALVTYFFHEMAQELARQRERFSALTGEREQERLVTSLGALAAGAAHELGTPLGTVQLWVGELEYLEGDARREAVVRIEEEVQRMKAILHGMTSTELSAQVLAELRPWDAGSLALELRREWPDLEVEVRGEGSTTQPRAVLAQILRELVRNAERAAGERAGIRVHLESGQALCCSVSDRGPGLDEEAQRAALRPFVSGHGG